MEIVSFILLGFGILGLLACIPLSSNNIGGIDLNSEGLSSREVLRLLRESQAQERRAKGGSAKVEGSEKAASVSKAVRNAD